MQAGRVAAPSRAGRTMRPASVTRGSLVVRAGFMSMFKPASPAPAKQNPRAAELVEELIDVAASTDAGTKASADKRKAIQELVEELQQFSVKNASKSSLLAGEYEVLYASAPAGPGGPLEGPSGAIPYSGNKPRQTISASGELTNEVTFKQFGMLEGFSRQFGTVKAVSPDTYEVELESAQFKNGLGPAEKLSLESELSVQLLYLGEDLRVVMNQVKGEDSSDLIVYRRIADSDDEEEEEEEAPAKRSGTMSLFGGSSSTREGTATMAERQVNRQIAEEAAKKAKQGGTGTVQVGRGGTGTVQVAPRSGTTAVKRGGTEAVVAKPAIDQQRKAAEAAKAVADKEKEAKAAKERAEAEKKAAAERQSAIKELLATLSEQLKDAQEEAKDAVKEFKDLEKSSTGALREVAAARADVKDAEEETAEAAKKLDQAMGARKEAEGRASEAATALALAQAKLKQAAASLTAAI